jgi:NADPH-dependent ferric siderophore reductase
LHEGGAATTWAIGARPGDQLEIGGPRGSMVVHDTFDYYLLVGDETALPSIARRIEGLRPGVPVTVIGLVDGPQERQELRSSADLNVVWVTRPAGETNDGALLRAALESWQPPAGDGYVWIAGEARTARVLRDYMLETRKHPKTWLRAAGYWVRGMAGASEKLES